MHSALALTDGPLPIMSVPGNPFAASEEQVMACDMVGRLFRGNLDDAGLGRGPVEPALWREVAALGIGAMLLPERGGGLGGSPRDVAVVADMFGRALAISPLAEGLVAATGLVARHGTEPAIERWVAPVLAGDAILAWAPGTVEIGAEGRLSGRLPCVRWAAQSQGLVVPMGEAAYVVAADAAAAMDEDVLLDGTPVGTVTLEGAQAERIDLASGQAGEAAALAQLCYVAEMVGAMALLHRETAEYTQQRRQFGAPIGSFQAVQHKLARMFVLLEQARSMVLKASCYASFGPKFERAVTSAKAYVAEAAQRLAEEAVQLHGGIGITNELVVGRGLRRIAVLARLFGGAEDARAQLAA